MTLLPKGIYDDLKQLQQNEQYINAIKEPKIEVKMWEDAPRYSKLESLQKYLEEKRQLDFTTVFHKPTGFYMLRCFLIANYAVDKAIFLSDVEKFRKVRFESARRRVGRAIYERFVNDDSKYTFPQGSSVFDILSKIDDIEQFRNPEGKKVSKKADTEDLGNVLSFGLMNNIGVFGDSVDKVKEAVNNNWYDATTFDEVSEEVRKVLKLGIFPRFKRSEFYKKYVRCCAVTRVPTESETKFLKARVTLDDFEVFRTLGRGGFGSVKACRKKNSGFMYAMKIIDKKRAKIKGAINNIIAERNVLVLINNSPFITNLKYTLQDDTSLYFIMDLMLGGDLKFHLRQVGYFDKDRAKFYAAQVLLGLEHIHSFGVIYRDLKLENVLIDQHGNARLADMGLALRTNSPIRGYAGTPGYMAPEMLMGRKYTNTIDIFSFGVLLFRMICGSKPFKGGSEKTLNEAVLHRSPRFVQNFFGKDSKHLLRALLAKDPAVRIGCGGVEGVRKNLGSKMLKQPIKDHPYFDRCKYRVELSDYENQNILLILYLMFGVLARFYSVDWGLLEEGYIDAPFIPDIRIHAPSASHIGDFNKNDTKGVKLDHRDQQKFAEFNYINERGLEDELKVVLAKYDEDANFEKYAIDPSRLTELSVSRRLTIRDAQKMCCKMA